jgi:hypothetical protein
LTNALRATRAVNDPSQRTRRVDHFERAIAEGRRRVEMVLGGQDDRVGGRATEGAVDVPERPGPDLAIVVDPARLVVDREVRVDPPQAVRHIGGVRDRVPVGDARHAVAARNRLAHRRGPLVTESLADRARIVPDAEAPRLRDAEAPRLRLLDRVTVFVPDHLEIFGVIDPAFPSRIRSFVGSK